MQTSVAQATLAEHVFVEHAWAARPSTRAHLLLATKARMRSVEFYRVPGVSNFPRTVLGVQPAPESKQDVSQLRDLH